MIKSANTYNKKSRTVATNEPNNTIAWIDCIWWHCDIVHHKSFCYYWANSFGWIWQMIHFSPCREKTNLSKTWFLFDFAQRFPTICTGIALDFLLTFCYSFARSLACLFTYSFSITRLFHPSSSSSSFLSLSLSFSLIHSSIYLHFVRFVAFYLFHFGS